VFRIEPYVSDLILSMRSSTVVKKAHFSPYDTGIVMSLAKIYDCHWLISSYVACGITILLTWPHRVIMMAS